MRNSNKYMNEEAKARFSLRKIGVGVVSVLLGLTFMNNASVVKADDQASHQVNGQAASISQENPTTKAPASTPQTPAAPVENKNYYDSVASNYEKIAERQINGKYNVKLSLSPSDSQSPTLVDSIEVTKTIELYQRKTNWKPGINSAFYHKTTISYKDLFDNSVSYSYEYDSINGSTNVSSDLDSYQIAKKIGNVYNRLIEDAPDERDVDNQIEMKDVYDSLYCFLNPVDFFAKSEIQDYQLRDIENDFYEPFSTLKEKVLQALNNAALPDMGRDISHVADVDNYDSKTNTDTLTYSFDPKDHWCQIIFQDADTKENMITTSVRFTRSDPDLKIGNRPISSWVKDYHIYDPATGNDYVTITNKEWQELAKMPQNNVEGNKNFKIYIQIKHVDNPFEKTPVEKGKALSQSEKAQIVKNYKQANPDSLINEADIDSRANAKILANVRKLNTPTVKTNPNIYYTEPASKTIFYLPEKTRVKDADNLTDAEKAAVKKAIEQANAAYKLTADKITVENNGACEIKFNDGASGKLTPDQTIFSTKKVEPLINTGDNDTKLNPFDKTPVKDLEHLTDTEKGQVEANIRKTNGDKHISSIEVKDNGRTIITFEDGTQKELAPDQTVYQLKDTEVDPKPITIPDHDSTIEHDGDANTDTGDDTNNSQTPINNVVVPERGSHQVKIGQKTRKTAKRTVRKANEEKRVKVTRHSRPAISKGMLAKSRPTTTRLAKYHTLPQTGQKHQGLAALGLAIMSLASLMMLDSKKKKN